MVEFHRSDYYPLTTSNVSSVVPSCPGIYLLAVRTPEGEHQTIFTSQSENLHRSLHLVIHRGSELHPRLNESLQAYECYFSYFVLPDARQRDEAAKLLTQTSDPIHRLVLSDSEETEAFEVVPAHF